MIKLVDNWYLDADPCNFIIGEKYIANEKNKDDEAIQVERLKNMKYYAHISDALAGVVRMRVRSAIEKKEVTTTKELMDLFVGFNNDMVNQFKDIETQIDNFKVVKHSRDTLVKSRKAVGTV